MVSAACPPAGWRHPPNCPGWRPEASAVSWQWLCPLPPQPHCRHPHLWNHTASWFFRISSPLCFRLFPFHLVFHPGLKGQVWSYCFCMRCLAWGSCSAERQWWSCRARVSCGSITTFCIPRAHRADLPAVFRRGPFAQLILCFSPLSPNTTTRQVPSHPQLKGVPPFCCFSLLHACGLGFSQCAVISNLLHLTLRPQKTRGLHLT